MRSNLPASEFLDSEPVEFEERWLSGRRHVPAKDAYPSKGTVGSNPTLSEFHCALNESHSRLFFTIYAEGIL